MKFLGSPYPIIRHPRGFLHTQSGVTQVKSDLLSLLLTNPNERVMLPDFGIALRRFIFEPNDTLMQNQVREAIIEAIRLWEPRITVQQIEVGVMDSDDLNPLDTEENIDHILSVKILFFDPEQIKEVQELRLEVPLAGETATGGVLRNTTSLIT